ncbi:MAG: MG2 domain-containing protein [Pirellulales bacterium]
MNLDADHSQQVVDDYVHGVLSRDEAAAFARHLAECHLCQAALEDAQRRRDAIRGLGMVEAPERLIQRTLARVDRHERGPARLKRIVKRTYWSTIAAAAVLLFVANAHFANLKPNPLDLRVLGQTTWSPASQAAIFVRLENVDTGQAIAGVPVQVELVSTSTGKQVRLASLETDESGTARPQFTVPDWAEGDYELRIAARRGWHTERVARTVALRRSWNLMLSSDKPIYQPGQTIRLRALALARADQKPVAGQEATFTIADPKGNVIFRQREATSRFGIAAADCPLADEIIEGQYRIECHVGDTASAQAVDVFRYVLPKFGMQIELDRPYYEPEQTIRGTVACNYYFGKPVAGATIEVVLETIDVGPRQSEKLEIKADDQGRGEFTIPLPGVLVGRPQHSGDAQVALRLTATDSAGQQYSQSVSRPVTRRPLRIEVVPEAGRLVRGVPNTVYVLTSYADGRPAQTRLAITGQAQEIQTDELGAAQFEITPPEQGDFTNIVMRATDAAGLTARHDARLSLVELADDFLVRLDRAVYDGGQTMQLTVLAAGSDPVFVDLIKDHQTVLSRVVELENGRGTLDVDLPAELAGTLELCAYRIGSAGFPIQKTRVVYVRAARALDVRVAADQPEYRPGGKARLTFTLVDDAGRPTPGAISLAAVDEAVFGVRSSGLGVEGTFFSVEQELLQPVYEIHDWSPGEFAPGPPGNAEEPITQRGNGGGHVFEQALFSRTWKVADGLYGRLARLLNRRAISPDMVRGADLDQLQDLAANFPDRLANQAFEKKGPHSLDVRSYPQKLPRAYDLKRSALAKIKFGWWIVGIVATIGALLVISGRRWVEWLVVLMILGVLGALLLPAINAAREAGARAQLRNNLMQIGRAMESTTVEDAVTEELPVLQAASQPGPESDGSAGPRVRQWFPETLLWRPELVTDDAGRAELEIDLADSITTWRMTASAVAADGRLGAGQTPLRVFQPFFVDVDLPVALVRGDEVAVPVVVYNYLERPQTVELDLAAAEWFELLGVAEQKLELAAGEVRSLAFRIRATKVGRRNFEVTARAADVADAVRRAVDVTPDGRLVEQSFSGSLAAPVSVDLAVPAEAIEGSVHAIVKFYPSTFSQVVEGLDAIFQRPYGCFEQTSSTTYPNALAIDYLRRTKLSAPEVEARARQYLHLGYQRLLGFEVPGGGFDWFGNPPANRTLTAYGLAEFVDMARVHDVDTAVINRTRAWLLGLQNQDGSWAPGDRGHLHEDPTRSGSSAAAQLSTTAYIAAAVFAGQPQEPLARSTRDYLAQHEPASISDPYLLALVARAIWTINAQDAALPAYLNRLATMIETSEDGKQAWWTSGAARTTFYGSGQSANIETTALATLTLVDARHSPHLTRAALAWLIAHKDPRGTWGTTQATVLTLKALLAATEQPLGGETERRLELVVDGGAPREIAIPADQFDVLRQLDLSSEVPAGKHALQIVDRSGAGTGYQVALRYHVPSAEATPAGREELSIDVAYDRGELATGDLLSATATITNRTEQPLPMVILDLPVPAGFAIERDQLAALVKEGTIAKFQAQPTSAILYLRALAPGEPLVIEYRLRATMPVRATIPAATAYEYYDPAKRAASSTADIMVREAS